VHEFKKGYQPRNNLVKNEKGNLLADSHNILNKRKNYISQPLNVYGAGDVKQMELHIAESLISASNMTIVTEKFKLYTSQSTETSVYFQSAMPRHIPYDGTFQRKVLGTQ
jgi:hypothetical protein